MYDLNMAVLLSCIGLLLIFNKRGDAVTSDDMKTLIDNILPTSGATPYYNSMRPLTNQENAVEVTADLYMIAINDFDDADQKLTTTAYLVVTWIDEVHLHVRVELRGHKQCRQVSVEDVRAVL